ncbi:hypothetical protein OROHE_015983 [Orobanche hederae]
MAMLGEWVSRVIRFRDSLLSRVLKVKYFPDCDIVDARPNPNGSFTWKSIFGTIDFVKRGLRWRVGNGQNIDVWGDNWMHPRSNLKPLTRDLYNLGNVAIVNFISTDGLGWNKQLLDTIFW